MKETEETKTDMKKGNGEEERKEDNDKDRGRKKEKKEVRRTDDNKTWWCVKCSETDFKRHVHTHPIQSNI
jgi:aryl-phospho-beta-D-glucosidase BglC (GH1 family)